MAGEGFLAYAPDLYSGATAKTIEQAESLSSKLDRKAADRKVVEAVDYLRSDPRLSGDRIGVIGFSLGALFALTLACNRPDTVSAVVLFYGTGTGEFDKAKAAFIGHFADNDSYEPTEEVSSLEEFTCRWKKRYILYIRWQKTLVHRGKCSNRVRLRRG